MKIIDKDKKQISRVYIYLTRDEAEELHDDLAALMDKPEGNHAHVSSENYKNEITICICDKNGDPL